jgi:NAD+ diphosphatase
VARVLAVFDSETIVRDGKGPGALISGGPRLALLSAGELPHDIDRYFLGIDPAAVPYFAVPVPLAELLATPGLAGTRIAHLREVGAALPPLEAAAAATAIALEAWHRRASYSPRSGAPTRLGEAGWTRVTADGQETLWPVTDPAVIALIHDGVPGPSGRCLLAHNASWQLAGGLPRYSCLAGFVEPGESAEGAVEREVHEEVGVAVRDIRYVTSQPWPFPGSLMLGFTALAEPDAPLVLDPSEIADARWFTRTEARAILAGRSEVGSVPLGISIARHLLARWAAEVGDLGRAGDRVPS